MVDFYGSIQNASAIATVKAEQSQPGSKSQSLREPVQASKIYMEEI